MNKAGPAHKDRSGFMVSDFDLLKVGSRAAGIPKERKKEQMYPTARRNPSLKFCRICHAPRLAPPGAGDTIGCGQLCRIIAPQMPPLRQSKRTSPETPPKSLTGREKVSLCPAYVVASGLPQPGRWAALIARTAFVHHLLKLSIFAPPHPPLGTRGTYL